MNPRMPSAEYLRSILNYDAVTGSLSWKERTYSSFIQKPGKKNPKMRAWNRRYAGRPALNSINSEGYRSGAINGFPFRAHRVAWCMQTGEWPDQIDHINGNRDDNSFSNLREVTGIVNSRNRKINSDNKSGVVGVHWRKSSKIWVAEIRNNGLKVYLGSFHVFEDACRARQIAQNALGFHENHGRPGKAVEA